MAALWALVALVGIGVLIALAALVWLVVYLVRSRGEESDAPASVGPHACGGPDQCKVCDDWMDIADVVSDEHAAALRAVVDDHFAEDYADVEIPLKGFTPLEEDTFHRNYAPMTDPERESLDTAFRKIDRRAGLTVMVRRVLAEHRAQTGADQ